MKVINLQTDEVAFLAVAMTDSYEKFQRLAGRFETSELFLVPATITSIEPFIYNDKPYKIVSKLLDAMGYSYVTRSKVRFMTVVGGFKLEDGIFNFQPDYTVPFTAVRAVKVNED